MAKTIKPEAVILTAEKIRNFTRLSERNRDKLIAGLLAGKVVAGPYVSGGDAEVTINGITVVLVFTGGTPVIIKVTGQPPREPKDPRPEWKEGVQMLLKDGYTVKRAATTKGVLIELTDKIDKNLHVTIAAL